MARRANSVSSVNRGRVWRANSVNSEGRRWVADQPIFLIWRAILGTMAHHSGYRWPWLWSFDSQPDYHDFHHEKFRMVIGVGMVYARRANPTDRLNSDQRKQRQRNRRWGCGSLAPGAS